MKREGGYKLDKRGEFFLLLIKIKGLIAIIIGTPKYPK